MRVPFDPSAPPVAVSPVACLSPEPGDERLCADLTADLVAGLARYRGVAATPARTGRGYLLTGTLRRAGDRLRLLLQLGDGRGGVLWSERLDGPAGALRSEVGTTLCARLAARLAALDRGPAVLPDGPVQDARTLVLLGRALGRRHTRVANLAARRLFAEAAAADPGCAPAHAGLSRAYLRAWLYGWEGDAADPLGRAVEAGRAAVDRDPLDARGHAALAFAVLYRKEYEAALAGFARATELNPNDPDVLVERAASFAAVGDGARALELHGRAAGLSPERPDWHLWYLARHLLRPGPAGRGVGDAGAHGRPLGGAAAARGQPGPPGRDSGRRGPRRGRCCGCSPGSRSRPGRGACPAGGTSSSSASPTACAGRGCPEGVRAALSGLTPAEMRSGQPAPASARSTNPQRLPITAVRTRRHNHQEVVGADWRRTWPKRREDLWTASRARPEVADCYFVRQAEAAGWPRPRRGRLRPRPRG